MAGPIPLPSEIQVEETLDGVRYTLPKKVEKNRAGGCAGAGLLVFGLAFGGFAAFWICMAAWGMAQSDEHIALRILFPAFGTPFLLIGLGIIFAGLYAIIGREEIILTRDRLSDISRAGPFRWTRRRRVEEITGIHPGRQPAKKAMFVGGRAIEVECGEKKPLYLLEGYPLNWQQALAAELAERVGVEAKSIASGDNLAAMRGDGSSSASEFGATRYQDRDVPLREPPRSYGFMSTSSSFGCMLAFAIIWNGFTFGGIAAVLNSNDVDSPIIAWIVLSIFAVVGLGIIGKVIHLGLARLKLHPAKMVISRHPLHIGEEFTITFAQQSKGNVQINAVTAKLLCRESATYRRGTDTHTDRHNVHEDTFVVCEAGAADSFRDVTGEITLRIPEDAMHSFEANRNSVVWVIETHTDVPNWPDYTQHFLLEILPLRLVEKEELQRDGNRNAR